MTAFLVILIFNKVLKYLALLAIPIGGITYSSINIAFSIAFDAFSSWIPSFRSLNSLIIGHDLEPSFKWSNAFIDSFFD